ncbi:MAG: hypothetical protein IJ500_01660 [Alphaproteobacteria bacterium]|nr:hypothetical protein [Alphaproteobacteria bacterium]
MKFFGNLLWWLISGAVCFMCRDALAISCSLNILASKYLSSRVSNVAYMDFTTCSNAGICYCNRYHCDISGDCAGIWERAETFTNVNEILDVEALCSGNAGYYISSCANAAGTRFNPTADNIVECASSFVCSACPNGGKSLTMQHALLNGGEYHGNPVYLCGQTNPATGAALDGIYMMEVQLSCTGGTAESVFNHITGCYQEKDSLSSDASGNFKWLSSCYYSE